MQSGTTASTGDRSRADTRPHRFWDKRHVLVTGAGGFVGSWLTHALVDQNANVTVILRDLQARSNFALLGLQKRVNVVFGSVVDYQLVERTVNEYEVDTCFHLAAQAIVGAANRSPLATFESNIKGTWNVLEACRVTSMVKRVVVASSDKAYGEQTSLPYVESMPLNAVYPYDTSKACAELLARSYHRSFGLPVSIARCANIYGGGDLNFSRLVPGTIRAVLKSERPVIRSDGSPVRDYLHVDDAISAYMVLCQRCGEVAGSSFNFGAGDPISVLSLVSRILRVAGRSDLEVDVLGPTKVSGEIDRQFLSSTMAADLLGWRPTVALDDGLSRTLDWYRAYLA